MRAQSPVLQHVVRHFEKALLGGGVAWLAVVCAGFVDGSAQPDSERILAAIRAIEDSMEGAAITPPAAAPAWQDALRRDLDPELVPPVETFPGWSMHRRPLLVRLCAPPRPPVELAHGCPQIEAVDAGTRWQVAISWRGPSELLNVELTGYEVWRRSGDGWRRIAELEPSATHYVDADVTPRTRYAYRVVSLAELDRQAPRVREAGLTQLPPEHRRRESEPSREVETPTQFYVVVNTVTSHDPITQPDGYDWAYLYVHRWSGDRFERRGFQVRVGEEVGEGAFATGATLRRVGSETRPGRWGGQERVQWAEVGAPGRGTERVNDRDIPEELAPR